jgi:glutathione S-transferase
MAITFYYGSGSPYAWRVWLALEHKQLPYEQVVLSFSAGDLRKPDYLALNPRGKVPTLRDDEFTLYESAAIVEYLDEAYPVAGEPLFPGGPRERALVRRIIREADAYLADAMEGLVGQLFFRQPAEWDLEAIARSREEYLEELSRLESNLHNPYLAGPLSAADLTVYPMIGLLRRLEKRKPDLGISAEMGPNLVAWKERMEKLPFFEKTYPPHWREG